MAAARLLSEVEYRFGRRGWIRARRGDDCHAYVARASFSACSSSLGFFTISSLSSSGLRDAARYMTRIELTDGNRDPCAQKDLNGVLYTADAANIATTAQPAAGGARARQRLERGRCHDQLLFERRARQRKLR